MDSQLEARYDVVIVGGGPAGLNAALMLARSCRSVLVLDDRQYRNAPAEHMHGFLSRDGAEPHRLREIGRGEVRAYGGTIANRRAVTAEVVADGIAVSLDDGTVVMGRRLLVATGLTDLLPDIPGVAERFGRDVVHCPYCHGWEVRDQEIGVLATGEPSVHQALLFRQLSATVTVLQHNSPGPTDEERRRLAARGITVVEGEVSALRVVDDRLTGAILTNGTVVPLTALALAPRMVARSRLLETLGITAVEHPSGMGEHIPAETGGRTAVPHVWVAGNVTNLGAQVLIAAAEGAVAGGMINADLVSEDTELAMR